MSVCRLSDPQLLQKVGVSVCDISTARPGHESAIDIVGRFRQVFGRLPKIHLKAPS
jgi:hypothetical protein